MKRISLTISVALVVAAFSVSAFAKTPENLVIAKNKIRHYVNSGEYMKSMSHRYEKAQAYVAKRIQENKSVTNKKKLAVVFDIDETTLSNYPELLKEDFGGTNDELNQVMNQGIDKAFPPAIKFYKYLLKNKVTPFFITGRTENMRAGTVKNLKAVGYTHYKHLYLMPNSYNKKSVIPFKSAARKKIESQGYDVVLTIGDQYSDLNGGYADAKLKLPDPFYYIA